jgi:hypothetical protein
MGLGTPRMGRLHSFSAEAAAYPRLHGDEWAGILSTAPVTWLWELPLTRRFRLQSVANRRIRSLSGVLSGVRHIKTGRGAVPPHRAHRPSMEVDD